MVLVSNATTLMSVLKMIHLYVPTQERVSTDLSVGVDLSKNPSVDCLNSEGSYECRCHSGTVGSFSV